MAAGIVFLIAGLFVYAITGEVLALWSELVLEIQSVQRSLHRQLAGAIQAIKAEGATASWALVVFSFFYGVFHAAGPGHGKVVISTYILTHESQLGRGLLLSITCALCQGITAIGGITITAGLLDFTLRQAQGAAIGLETLSYCLVVLLGLALMLGPTRRLIELLRVLTPNIRGTLSQTAFERHKHDEACSNCEHVYGPARKDLNTPLTWKMFIGMVASIGLRPCSGAVLVLLVAYSLELYFAGISAVLAMSLGTAITVSLLATLSVYAREGALRFASLIPGSTARLALTLDLIAFVGGSVVLISGILMLQAALTVSAHPLR